MKVFAIFAAAILSCVGILGLLFATLFLLSNLFGA